MLGEMEGQWLRQSMGVEGASPAGPNLESASVTADFGRARNIPHPSHPKPHERFISLLHLSPLVASHPNLPAKTPRSRRHRAAPYVQVVCLKTPVSASTSDDPQPSSMDETTKTEALLNEVWPSFTL